jgi:hypothetical protein
VIGGSVETRTGTSEGASRWVLVLVVLVAGSGYLNITDLTSWKSVDFGASVRVLRGWTSSVYERMGNMI